MQDTNFSFKNISNNSYLVYNIEDIDKIDKVEHNMITNNNIEGLLNVIFSSIDDVYFYKYDITSKIPLKRYINACHDKDKIIKILLSTLNVFAEIEDFMIIKEHIVLDNNYVFVDVSDSSLHFVCLPINDVEDVVNKFNLKIFINNIISNLDDNFENKNLLYLLKNVLNKDELLDIRGALNILKNIDSNKNFIKQEEINKVYKLDEKIEVAHDFLNNTQKRNIKKLNEDDIIKKENNVKNIDFLVPGQKEKVELKKADNKNIINLKNIFKKTDISKKHEEKKSGKVIELEKIDENEEIINYNNTVLIKRTNSNEETSLLYALNSGLYQNLPYLIRKKNSEKINITSDLFRMGKEIDYVDYAIKDNNTISRAHADIIKINKDYYIQDNNSKNHTYVNDTMVCDGQAIKLDHNYEIKLSDELFIFKLY